MGRHPVYMNWKTWCWDANLPKFIYRHNATPIWISPGFFAEIDKPILTFMGPRIAKTNVKDRVGGITLSNFKTDYKVK